MLFRSESIKLLNAYTCHYDVNTLDGNVIIGRPPELDNFYLVAGFSGHGLMQSPAIGRAISELVTFGEYRTLDLTRFGYERVLTGEKIRRQIAINSPKQNRQIASYAYPSPLLLVG